MKAILKPACFCGLLGGLVLAIAPKTQAQTIDFLTPHLNRVQTESHLRGLGQHGSSTTPINNSQQSMLLVKQGLTEQKRGDRQQALAYYYRAVKADSQNAFAFLAAGDLLGNTKEGIGCMKKAATLFEAQGNRQGYSLAINWLTQRGALD